jgi:hypothetical protein
VLYRSPEKQGQGPSECFACRSVEAILDGQALPQQPGFIQAADLSAGTLLDRALLVRRVTLCEGRKVQPPFLGNHQRPSVNLKRQKVC